MISIDKLAYASKLKRQNPLEKLFFALLTLGVCLGTNSLAVSMAVIFIMAWVTVRRGGTPLSLFLKLLLIPMIFLIIGVSAIAVEIKNDPQHFIVAIPVFDQFLGVAQTGILTSLKLFFKSLGAVSCLYYLALNTPLVDILMVLRKLRCPKLLVELMNLVYRFIFVLLATAGTMYTAQNSRLGYAGLAAGYRSMGVLVSTLFIRAYRHSDELYTAMEARGYDGEINVLEEALPYSWKGFFPAIGINLLLIMIRIVF